MAAPLPKTQAQAHGHLLYMYLQPTCARQQVLLNAFTRATKDAFPPSRVAGLKVGALCLALSFCWSCQSWF